MSYPPNTVMVTNTVAVQPRRVNKLLYVLMCFFFGCLGVHRFLRGQVGLGILMIFLWIPTMGIWWLVDFIISLVKLPQYPGDDFLFSYSGHWLSVV